jgi:hypothetical protein
MSFINSSSSQFLWKSNSKPRYFEKYENIFKELFENDILTKNSFANIKKNYHTRENSEYSNITLLTSTIDTTNSIRDRMSRTKYNILTGKDLNKFSKLTNENEKKENKLFPDNFNNNNYNVSKNIRNERNKNRTVIKNFGFYLRNQGIIPSYNLLKKNESNSLSPRHNHDNLFIERMHRKFPEYVNLKTKGQTFLLLSNQLDSKKPFHELKNKIGKL